MIPEDMEQRLDALAVALRAGGEGVLDCRELVSLENKIDHNELVRFLEICRLELYLRLGDVAESMAFSTSEEPGWLIFHALPGAVGQDTLRA